VDFFLLICDRQNQLPSVGVIPPPLFLMCLYIYWYMKIIITESQYNFILNEDDNSIYKLIKDYITKESEKLKVTYGKNKQMNIVDIVKIIDNIRDFLISKISSVFEDMKKGVGGDKFAKECYEFIYQTVSNELNNLNFLKKNSIKLLAGGKEGIRKKLEERGKVEIDNYLDNFSQLMDFSFPVGYRDDMKVYEDKLISWYKQMEDWFGPRLNSIGKNIINLIVSKF